MMASNLSGFPSPISGAVTVPDTNEGESCRILVYVAVERPGQVQLAAKLTCTLGTVRPNPIFLSLAYKGMISNPVVIQQCGKIVHSSVPTSKHPQY